MNRRFKCHFNLSYQENCWLYCLLRHYFKQFFIRDQITKLLQLSELEKLPSEYEYSVLQVQEFYSNTPYKLGHPKYAFRYSVMTTISLLNGYERVFVRGWLLKTILRRKIFVNCKNWKVSFPLNVIKVWTINILTPTFKLVFTQIRC